MMALQLQRIFKAHAVKGRVGIYGHTDISTMFAMLNQFKKLEPEIEFVGETREDSLFIRAMETKTEERSGAHPRDGQASPRKLFA